MLSQHYEGIIQGYSRYTARNIVAKIRDFQKVSLLGYMGVYYSYFLKLFSYYTGCSKSPKSIKVVFF